MRKIGSSRLGKKIQEFKIFKHSKNLILNPLFSGSMIMIIGSNFGNFVAYIYHVVFGRMLGPSAYGELVTILSILGLISTTFSFLGLVIVKIVSQSSPEYHDAEFSWFIKRCFKIGVAITLLFLGLSPIIASFTKVKLLIILIAAPYIFLSILTFVYRSFLQGLLKFKELIISQNMELFVRFLLGLALIIIGYSVMGAGVGITAGGFVSYFLTKHFLKLNKNKTNGVADDIVKVKEVVTLAVPIFISSFVINSFISSDIVLVKHFFNAHDAGIYSSLSVLGKIIFFATAPIASVMFPMVSQRKAKGQSYNKIVILSLILAIGIEGFVMILYMFFPKTMINLLYGSKYLEGYKYLVWFGFFMSIFTLSTILINYFISVGKTKIVYIMPFMGLIQIIGIWLYHSSILTVVHVSTFAASLLLLSLLIYFVYDLGGKKSKSNQVG